MYFLYPFESLKETNTEVTVTNMTKRPKTNTSSPNSVVRNQHNRVISRPTRDP